MRSGIASFFSTGMNVVVKNTIQTGSQTKIVFHQNFKIVAFLQRRRKETTKSRRAQ